MKIFTFVFSSDTTDDQGRKLTSTKHIVAKDLYDALSVASEKGLTGFIHLSEGPEVFAVAGFFE